MICVIIAAPNSAITASNTTSQTVSSFFRTIHFCVIPRITASLNYRSGSDRSEVVVSSLLVPNIRQVNDASAEKNTWCGARTMSTGMALCVSTLTVSLPSTTAEIPRRPCEAMTIKSHDFRAAVSMMARYG